MAKRNEQEAKRLSEWQSALQFYGTKENGYTDSGFWSFLNYVYTRDSHDKNESRKLLMGDAPEYLVVVFLYMLACDVLAVPKSRQMRLSWATTAFSVWHTMSGKDRHTIYQTKKEDDAFAMVSQGHKNPCAGRMDFIIQHLPTWFRDSHIVSGKGNQVGCLTFSPSQVDENGYLNPFQGSAINAIPQGAHQIRQYTPSLVVSDESAFQEEFENSMVACRPAVAGGGKVICVSSEDAGSAFNRMVLESVSGDVPQHEIHPDVKRGLDILGIDWPKGLRSWLTPSGVWCLEVHYTADPAKDPARDGAAWVEEAVRGYVGGFESSAWKKEMEIDYNAGGGDPVFPFLSGPGHPVLSRSVSEDQAIGTMSIYAGYDYGARNPAAFEVWGFDKRGHAFSLWEMYEACTNIADHVQKMKKCPYWDHIKYIACDPSITAKTQQTASGTRSIAEIFADHGVHFTKGRRGADVPMAIRFLSEYWADPENPTAFITKATPALMQEVMDLRWDRHISAGVDARKNALERIRDKNNHAWDATAYLFDTRPSAWIAPTPKRPGGIIFNDLLEKADRLQYERNYANRGGIKVV